MVDGKSIHVPNVLKEMLELRYLQLPYSIHDQTLLELGKLVNLETLSYFSTKHSSLTDLIHMTRLRILTVSISGEFRFETLSSCIREMRDLKELFLVRSRGEDHEAYYGAEFDMNFIHLNFLGLGVHMPWLSDQQRFPPQLGNINLHRCYMVEDPMSILEKLLHLESVVLNPYAFVGRKMVCSKGGYLQLLVLKVYGQPELEEWIVEKGSMPCLRALTVGKCHRLMRLPDGLKYITSLKKLEIMEMKRQWVEKLVPVGEDYYKVQHIPNVQFVDCNEE